MMANVQRVRRVLGKGIGIMILGETGTGKEAVAQAIHQAGPRASRPFVGINCAAIPETLIESELFGYVDGAFTGARRGGVRGKVQLADGGTLFLDEIGDMPLMAQTRLLRVLAEREILPLGHVRPIAVDLDVICATHQDLQQLVAEGRFREDLYYRLNNLSLTLPPLRDRADKADLIRGFCTPARIDPPALAALLACRWPGNIRQVQSKRPRPHASPLVMGVGSSPSPHRRAARATVGPAAEGDAECWRVDVAGWHDGHRRGEDCSPLGRPPHTTVGWSAWRLRQRRPAPPDPPAHSLPADSADRPSPYGRGSGPVVGEARRVNVPPAGGVGVRVRRGDGGAALRGVVAAVRRSWRHPAASGWSSRRRR